ncbi:hypothetical protein GCM10007897_43230 [Sphingobium jiangsuense]|nr:hypothetical protein GCM10007897_43230 [Sphingobium jiangsuense]
MAVEGKGGGRRKSAGLVLQRGVSGGVQRRKQKRTRWTAKRQAQFIEELQASCNVMEAARRVGVHPGQIYAYRRRDPAFAAQWAEALEQGYAELEMLLLRQAIHGTETTETVEDGKGEGGRRTKRVHSFPHAVALRLLLAHRGTVDAYRAEKGRRADEGEPGGADVRSEIQRRIAAMRPDAAGDAAGGDEAGGAEDGEA